MKHPLFLFDHLANEWVWALNKHPVSKADRDYFGLPDEPTTARQVLQNHGYSTELDFHPEAPKPSLLRRARRFLKP